MKNALDFFSEQAATYAEFRPAWPPELLDFLLGLVPEKRLAWDVATGNGQVAVELADHFERILATDISEAQLAHAVQKPNINYRLERAETCSAADQSVDLITIGQAIHWLDFDHFYAEIRRVARPGAIFAAFGYGSPEFYDDRMDDRFNDFYLGTLGDYWSPERRFIDEKYETLPFPFEEIAAPNFWIYAPWHRHEFAGYLESWSAVQKFKKANGYSPVEQFVECDLAGIWGEFERQKASFPVLLRVGRVH